MKIRTRLLVFLLPAIIVSNLLIAAFLSYHWYREIYTNYRTQLTASLMNLTSLLQREGYSFNVEDFSKQNLPKLEKDMQGYLKEIPTPMPFSHLSLILLPSQDLLSPFPQKNSAFIQSFSLLKKDPLAFQSPLTLETENFPISYLEESPSFKEGVLPSHYEQFLYHLKTVHITPIYRGAEGQKIMSGYAPIFDRTGRAIAILAAQVSAGPIGERLQEKLLIISLSTGFMIALATLFLWIFASKISRPIQKLGGSALAIAAGQYGDKIQVKGPKEIIELANTLNTMSECLHENINRLKENSLLRERMYGEYECAMLLQHLMLQKMIDDCHSDAIAVKAVTFFSDNPRGLLLDLPKKEGFPLSIHLIEAKEIGFEGMYELLTQYKLSKGAKVPEMDETFSSLHVSIDLNRSSLSYSSNHFTQPLLWSIKNQSIIENGSREVELLSGDFFFLFNEACLKLCGSQKKIQDIISKILKYFADEGLDTCVKMIQKELAFLVKKKDPEEDIHFISFQILI